jgi:hypothetical protein
LCSDAYEVAKGKYKNNVRTKCGHCGKNCIIKRGKDFAKSKSGLGFCNHSCATKYNNAHKTMGTRRSKLEYWLETQLPLVFPNLEIRYNTRDEIKSELDIYLPSLNLAFELNGIFHYEPIYGAKKLAFIQNNDQRKMQACLEKGIELCIIDTSGQKYFKSTTAQKYLDIIVSVIKQKLVI